MGIFGKRTLWLALFMVGTLIAQSAQGEGYGEKSKWGITVDRIQNANSGEFGVLLGFRHVGYFDSTNTYAGYEIHAGSARGGSPAQDNLTYGGLSLGFDGAYLKTVSYDFGVLIGYGFGNVSRLASSGQSLAVQPSMSVGLIMLSGYRASFEASYLYMPGANAFSSMIYGIRLERKLISTSSPTSD